MAIFKCPHCGEELHVKVFLKDVTPTKALTEEKIIEEATESILRSLGQVNETNPVQDRVVKKQQPDPLTGLFSDMHKELLEKRAKLSDNNQLSERELFERESNTYISSEQAGVGEEAANRIKKMFGG